MKRLSSKKYSFFTSRYSSLLAGSADASVEESTLEKTTTQKSLADSLKEFARTLGIPLTTGGTSETNGNLRVAKEAPRVQLLRDQKKRNELPARNRSGHIDVDNAETALRSHYTKTNAVQLNSYMVRSTRVVGCEET